MSIVVYAKKFEDMTAYSRQATYALDEKWKINQFLFGFTGETSHSVTQREFITYVELLRQCYMSESSLKNVQEEKDQYRVGQKDQGRPSHQFRPTPQPFKGKQVQHAKPTHPSQCQLCNRFHFGRCVRRVIRCFNCQMEGYLARDYLHKNVQAHEKSFGRVYTLDTKNANGNNDFIVGTCNVNGHPYFILFNCGLTHSFVSTQCMKRLGLKGIPLSTPMMVTAAMDDAVETLLICENCLLSVNGRVSIFILYVYHLRSLM